MKVYTEGDEVEGLTIADALSRADEEMVEILFETEEEYVNALDNGDLDSIEGSEPMQMAIPEFIDFEKGGLSIMLEGEDVVGVVNFICKARALSIGQKFYADEIGE